MRASTTRWVNVIVLNVWSLLLAIHSLNNINEVYFNVAKLPRGRRRRTQAATPIAAALQSEDEDEVCYTECSRT